MYRLIRELLFKLDPESAHEWTVAQIERLQQIPIALRIIERVCRPPASAACEVLGMRFRSPIGIAAGFDKNAVMVPMLAALGFGFVEVGTVTLRPQPGNPRPRLFRDAGRRALVNRMGFNNDGADGIAERLRRERAVPVFVNIGKNRDVPLEGAAENYAACYERVAPHADATIVNLSSPNTPGLRDLQRPEELEKIVAAIPKRGPLLIKIAPDLDDVQLGEICDVCARLVDGMVCTNTTKVDDGGLSGAPLMEQSTDILARVRKRVSLPLIGVGGIFTKDDVRAKMAAGANLVQLYTGFIYEGPMIAKRLA
ncbi:MAG TPA: quinone-dependent dihydroorotate dehydrogenase [Thermoanaerobaculia bacterium]|nr:quinone-dependent dihydroorotate dehydrogenase [Thermoanaerobaculia bacterium]